MLILYELGISSPSESVIDQPIRSALENSPFQVELYREYLETTLFPSPAAQKEIQDWYIHKYRNLKLDLVITVGPSPLKFVVKSYEKSFKDIPVVFGGLSGEQPKNLKLKPQFTGVWDIVEPTKTLEAALRLQPGTKHVVVVGGKDDFDLEVEALFHEVLHSYESKLDITYFTDFAMPQLLERLKHLPPKTIVFMTHIGLDAAGTHFIGASQADPLVVEAANAPVFGLSDVDLGHGEVGGYLDSFAMQGRLMGEMAAQILKGHTPQNIPIVRGADVYMFDWKAFKRWGLDEKNLPLGSLVLNREPSLWVLYRWYVFGGLVVLLAQTAAIFALLWQRARRKKAQTELRKSEEKFSKAFQQSPLAFTLASFVDYRFVEVNDTFEDYTGWKRDEVIGRTPLELGFWVDNDQRSIFLEQLRSETSVRNMELLFRRKDGRVWTSLVSSELINVNGEPCALSLLADITEAKKAEEARIESEQRFQLVANTAPVMIWMSGPDKLCNYFNQPWLDFTGRPLEAELGNGWADRVHPEDLTRCMHIYTESFDQREPFRMEYRLRRKDEKYRWVFDIGVPRFGPTGSFVGYIGSCIDVTERKLAEEALSSVNRRLLQAQEQERARIARELHDDINQRIAIIAVDLDALQQHTSDSTPELLSHLKRLEQRILEVSHEVQAISHRLHSSKLEYLGLVLASRGFCRELAERHGVNIDFKAESVPRELPSDVSLTLFRVLQESLQNAIKHSGTKDFNVRLCGLPNEIRLTVRDEGSGFDTSAAMDGHGLGLISMKERVGSLNGTISITSRPMGGTEIDVRVPIIMTGAVTLGAA